MNEKQTTEQEVFAARAVSIIYTKKTTQSSP